MSTITKILIPIDFSKSAKNALDYAIHFCSDKTCTEITLIYVKEEKEISESEILAQLKWCKDRFSEPEGIKCNVLIKEGSLNDALIQEQRESGYDLIIMGTKGADKQGIMVTTHTSSLVQKADCPVLVIPESCDTFSVSNIALALDKREIDDSFALGILHDIARKNDAKVHILTIESENEKYPNEDKNESVLEYYLETLDYRYSFPNNSDIETGIMDYVKEKKIDLLAILPRNHAKKSPPSEGRLTKLLTLHSDVPVLTID